MAQMIDPAGLQNDGIQHQRPSAFCYLISCDQHHLARSCFSL